MFDTLKRSLQALHEFSHEEFLQLQERLVSTRILRGDFLIKQGQICDFVTFVHRGSLRHFSYSEENEITLDFFVENDWVVDQQSFVAQKPSANFIQTNEDSEVVTIGGYQLHDLVYRYPNFLRLGAIMEQSYNNRVRFDIEKSPDERYENLLKNHPVWIERFAQKHIASYLGVTAETLSRVRARIK